MQARARRRTGFIDCSESNGSGLVRRRPADRKAPATVSTDRPRKCDSDATVSIHCSFVEILTESAKDDSAIFRGGQAYRPTLGGTVMHYEDTAARKTQLMALVMTVAVVGGAIFYAMV